MTASTASHSSLPQRAALGAIRLYQLTLSPYLGRQCRFFPTCSHYAAEAIQRHGLARGGWLALRRLVRCQPLHPGGVDLVPLELSRDAAEIVQDCHCVQDCRYVQDCAHQKES